MHYIKNMYMLLKYGINLEYLNVYLYNKNTILEKKQNYVMIILFFFYKEII